MMFRPFLSGHVDNRLSDPVATIYYIKYVSIWCNGPINYHIKVCVVVMYTTLTDVVREYSNTNFVILCTFN